MAATSLWRFEAAKEGFRRSNMTAEERAAELSGDDFSELSALIDG